MRIISDFSDYYDKAMMYGADEGRVWVRKTGTYNIPSSEVTHIRQEVFDWMLRYHVFDYNTTGLSCTARVLGVAGKCYPYVRMEYCDLHRIDSKSYVKYAYSSDQIRDFLAEHKLDYALLCFDDKSTHWASKLHTKRKLDRIYFNNAQIQKFEKWFMKCNTTTFDVDLSTFEIETNCNIGERQFYQVVDMCTVYQQIEFFLFDIIQTPPEIDQISDTELAEKKGFDKWSFRKAPTKKRRRKSRKQS